ncbi:MAG: thioredoxin-like domain-containing protein [Patescibacteria group bacterium]
MAVRVPAIVGDIWFNTSHPITPEELSGRVVLVDFFDYSCVNCLRTIPHLRKIWDRYKHLKFFIIGVHTPEFAFEKDSENVEQALKDLEIHWPVVLDNDYINWNNFANHYWPAEYLIDQNGYIVYQHYGENGYAEIETKIQELLVTDFGDKGLPPIEEEKTKDGRYCTISTPELYCGHSRGRIVNDGGYHYDHIANYIKPDEIPEDSIALAGQWNAMPEYLESFAFSSTLFLRFRGTEVNLVLEPAEDDLASIHLELDGKSLSDKIAGKDVDQSDVIITKSRMYNLIKTDKPLEGVLSIKATESNFRVYAFTFSGCI